MTYLEWLKSQVEYFDGPSHNLLLDRLHSIQYIPVIDKDWNRYYDGIALRNEVFSEMATDASVIDTPCSFLEFLVALARRMNYIYADIHEDCTADLFWMIIRNAFVSDMNDDIYQQVGGDERVDEVVNRITNRIFDGDGHGGLFPLKRPPTNQRNVEVWYQMNQYLVEVMRDEGRM